MCLVAFAWNTDPRFPLILVSNRDEFHDRPSAAWHAWEDAPLHGGRDLQAGGAWLALTAHGRLALLTNIREPVQAPGHTSRGAWVPQWLLQGTLPTAAEAQACGGFNLLTLDLQAGGSAGWHRNRPTGLQSSAVPPGLHGLSNAALNTPWPKTQRLVQGLRTTLERREHSSAGSLRPHWGQHVETLGTLLTDATHPPDDALPHTGVSLAWERLLGPIFVQSPDGRYGTRASTVVVAERLDAVSAYGSHAAPCCLRWHVMEQRWGPHGADLGRQSVQIDVFPSKDLRMV